MWRSRQMVWGVLLAIALGTVQSFAEVREGQEQCRVVSKSEEGTNVGLIKANQADGIGTVGVGNPYAGKNLDGERNAWIWVPKGMCKLINEGKLKTVPKEILEKIHLSGLPTPEEEEDNS